MAIRIAVNHRTSYRYDRLVTLSPQIVRLRPAPHCRTPIVSYSLKIAPKQHFCNWQQDPHGNYLARLVFPEKTREFAIEVDLVADLTVINPFDFFVDEYAEKFPFVYEPWLAQELAPFLKTEPPGPRLAEYVRDIDLTPLRTVLFLVGLNARLRQEVKYLIRLEPGVQSCEETLTLGSGSCRDTAWLLVQILRNLGLAARFVSGYSVQLVADLKPLDGPAGVSHDVIDLHAWTEVYIPGAGWVGLDATSGLFTGEGHIPLACTPDPSSAAPIVGGVGECEQDFQFAMSVTRIHEDPRVTKPYTDQQWQAIEALGHRIDAELQQADVRLTVGGEPTFVSIDDMDGDEWNIAAQGPTKRLLAAQLIQRLKDHYAPGGLLHYGQGKWYPGESLPRWALSCYWRRDGQPLWINPDLIADEARDYGHGAAQAQQFAAALAERLEVGAEWVVPAYEEVWHYLMKERRLPVNVDPLKSQLKDEEERRRLAHVFERGLNSVVGAVLPLKRQEWQGRAGWISGPWPLRQERLYLLPGDSPIGLRLPLESLPWVAPTELPLSAPLDPLAERSQLPDRGALAGRRSPEHVGRSSQAFVPGAVEPRGFATAGRVDQQLGGNGAGTMTARARHAKPPAAASSGGTATLAQEPEDVVRTAVCVEPRQGRLHVFMPPVECLEDYVELLAAVEETAAELQLPVVIEGYLPPHDYRLNHIKVTPDPGVIEVNIHPAHNWEELVHNTTTVYELARLTRLGTEKFMLDGRHSGTGGGNHVVLGGPTPADSPFLRRPDLLRSLLGYWNNHPSLSYLFSTLFVGPTSQSPRADESRCDAIYELQIAFQQIPAQGPCPPWLVDRAFRHLLVDTTGNTHRAEFCIDKLYSPDTATGRLGLVEMRAFEMPPHARMSLTQQLLVRALVAWFWRQPYQQRLVQWGTALHDRFMLPHFVQADFRTIVAELEQAGFPLALEWFAPHFEFRFPQIGQIAQRDVQLELRTAIEPWYVLGEEPGGGGTARYVDSSVERVQVKVTGLVDTRHIVTCNGRKVPLTPTGTVGEYVAAVRYRAWQPPSCLHPTIAVHTPLVFDLLDTWLGRSIGGCTYHVAHPGGLSYTTYPVNAYEAETRRATRFLKMGHTGGPMSVPVDEPNPEFPLTLDLRRVIR